MEEAGESYPFGEPTEQLQRCRDELISKYPPLEEIADDDNSIWSVTPECISGYIGLNMSFDTSVEDLEWIISTAHRYGFAVFDPQSEELHMPDGRVLKQTSNLTPLHKIFRLLGLRKDN